MDRREIIKHLDSFPYDSAEYWVITGAAMVLYGIRGETSDIDLGCSEKMADLLSSDGCSCGHTSDGKRRFRYGENIEVLEGWIRDRVEKVDGIPVISINGLIEMKRELGREKDKKDLALIEQFLQRAAPFQKR